MFLSSLVKLSYTITHDGLTFSSKKKKFCATSISVRVASLRPHTADPSFFRFKADSAQVDKSCWRVYLLTYLEPLGHKLLSNNVLHLNCDILLLPLEGLLNWKTSNLLVTC